MTEARTLLTQYVRSGSESAFRELVRRFTNLAYATALRLVGGDAQLAEDVAQTVFVHLARNARRISGEAALGGWWHRDACIVAATTMRTERRRRFREQQAVEMNSTPDHTEANLARLAPVLDEAIKQLESEDRAPMRVNRALEKLHSMLLHKGVSLSAAALATALAAEAATAAPAGMAASLAGAALASAAGASTLLTLIKSMSITKVSLISALVAAGVGVPAWQQARLQRAQSENAQLRVEETELRGQDTELVGLRSEVEGLRKVEADHAELERLRQWQAQTEPELLRLHGMAGLARRANAEAEQLRAQLARQASQAGGNPISGAMADAMKQAMEQRAESQLARLTASLHLTADQAQAAREILLRQGQAMSAGMQQAFSGKFDKEELARLGKEAGNPDDQIKALLTPDQRTAYPTYKQEESAYNARQAASAELLQLSSLGLTSEQEDRAFAALYQVTLNQLNGSAKPTSTDQAEIMQWTLDQKAQALEPVLTPSQLASFRQQQALQSKLAKDILNKLQGGGSSQ